MRPCALWGKVSGLVKNKLIFVSNVQRGIFHGLVDIQPDQQRIVFAAKISHSSQVRA